MVVTRVPVENAVQLWFDRQHGNPLVKHFI
jgi:hypothetical protein